MQSDMALAMGLQKCARVRCKCIAWQPVQDAGTVYFDESAEEARRLSNQVLADFAEVLASVGDDERMSIERSHGLKMEQLKAELDELNHLHDDD